MNIGYIKETLLESTEKLMNKIKGCFAGKSGENQARKYIGVLLLETERKNGWQMAEARGDATPYAIQQFLYRGSWESNEVMSEAREYAIEELGEEDGTLIADESGFPEKGTKSAGVSRQYSGTLGKVDNCQVGVFLSYASVKGYVLALTGKAYVSINGEKRRVNDILCLAAFKRWKRYKRREILRLDNDGFSPARIRRLEALAACSAQYL